MVKIKSAICEVCGKEFTGKNCVEEAGEHEKIPIIPAEFEIGDIALIVKAYPDSFGSKLFINAREIESIDNITQEHEHVYNNGKRFGTAIRIKSSDLDKNNTILLTKEQNYDVLDEINVKVLELLNYEINHDLDRNRK